MLNYNHLHYFHVVATLGSIASAANRLGITQPTVSEQLRTLERTLGLRLFERTPSGLVLTDAGRLAYEHTSVMFRAGERLVESLIHTTKSVPQSFRVGISSVVSRTTTTDFLMPLFQVDNCVPSVRSGDTSELLREMRERTLDLVLVEGEPPELVRNGLECAVVASTKLVAVSPTKLKGAADWTDAGLLHYRASSVFRWEVENFLERNSLRPRVVGEADDPTFLLESAIRGGYIAVVPRTIVRDALRAGRVVVLAEVDASHAGVHAVYQDDNNAHVARRAVELLVAHAQAMVD